MKDAEPVWDKDTDPDKWTYTFTDLPACDASGIDYYYRVTEEPLAGYDSKDEGNGDFTNVKEGSLTVYKNVTGSGGSYTRDFQFTVTLTGTSKSGIAANTFSEEVRTSDGSIQFTNGVATFTLRHNQSLTINGLPAGLTYTVTETPVDGYETTSDNTSETIQPGEQSMVTFTNFRSGGGSGDESTSLTVVKRWILDDGGRTSPVTVQLLQNGTPDGAPVVLDQSNNWTYTWNDLDAKSNWSVEEIDGPDGFTPPNLTATTW